MYQIFDLVHSKCIKLTFVIDTTDTPFLKKYLFRPSLSFLAEAQPRLENKRGQKTLFRRGAHYIF
jgi:hypothetical protein